jgi:hypothetical protein
VVRRGGSRLVGIGRDQSGENPDQTRGLLPDARQKAVGVAVNYNVAVHISIQWTRYILTAPIIQSL